MSETTETHEPDAGEPNITQLLNLMGQRSCSKGMKSLVHVTAGELRRLTDYLHDQDKKIWDLLRLLAEAQKLAYRPEIKPKKAD